MMKSFIFLLFCCLQLCYGLNINGYACDTSCKIVVAYGNSLVFAYNKTENGILDKFIVEINNKTFEIYPTNEMNHNNAYFDEGKYNSNKLTLSINSVNFDLSGKWKSNITSMEYIPSRYTNSHRFSDEYISATYNNSCEIVVEQDIKILPTNYIVAAENTYVKLYFNDFFEEITECLLIKNNTEYYKLFRKVNIKKIQHYGKCGFKILVDKSMNGNWKIIQKSGEYKIKKAELIIQIYEDIHLNESQRTFTWTEGSKKSVYIPYPLSGRNDYCEWVQPNGHIIITSKPNCTYDIKKVTKKSHAGIWKCRFRVPNERYLKEFKLKINVKDSVRDILTSVNITDTKILLKCTTIYRTFDYCLFRMPNGTIINILDGNLEEKYEYYGQGYGTHYRGPNDAYLPGESLTLHDPILSECGLKISNPSPEDNGAWKCIIGWKNYSTILSAYMPVNLDTVESLNITANDVSVKKHDSFIVECSVNAQLSYCWIENDMIKFSHMSMRKIDDKLQDLINLANGICTVSISSARLEHDGIWSCKFGIKHLGISVENSIFVSVRDFYLIPTWNKSENETIETDIFEMSCQLASEIDDTIRYCRWKCIPETIDDNPNTYTELTSSYTSTSCYLKIKYIYKMLNPGKCTCYAGLAIKDDEIFAIIDENHP